MRRLLIGRMGSLPMFVKMLKQRYALGFNREHDRVGTLWEGCYRSVLVEPSREALLAVGAYIDLNPVRAGMVKDPKDYRWSGYGEAVGRGKVESYALLERVASVEEIDDSGVGAGDEEEGEECQWGRGWKDAGYGGNCEGVSVVFAGGGARLQGLS